MSEQLRGERYIRSISFTSLGVLGIVTALLLCLPFLTHAQTTSTTDDLSATIRTALLSDPRSADLSAAQTDALVSALSAQAQSQGMTAQDIAYQPDAPVALVAPGSAAQASDTSDPCASSPSCALGETISAGIMRNPLYPALWILALLLIAIIWHVRKNPHLMNPPKAKDIPAIGAQL